MRIDRSLRPGLAFMTFHFPDQVETNVLTIDATDPKSGTAEFKATAIRVEKLPVERGRPRRGGGPRGERRSRDRRERRPRERPDPDRATAGNGDRQPARERA